ncbi:MAG: hypothetical protein WDM87_17315 [Terracidiphilus sp.]
MLAPCVMRVSSACWITVSPTRAAAARVSRIMLSLEDRPSIVSDCNRSGGFESPRNR